MNKNLILIIGVVVALIIGISVGYSWGSKLGYTVGYDKAIVDTKAIQEALSKKAMEDATAAANPFKVTNPLEGVTVNPFEETAKKLNPFFR